MKTAKQADNLKAFTKKVLKDAKAEETDTPQAQVEPLRAIVKAVLAYDTTDTKVEEAMTVIDREFVDINEFRVATELEMQDLIGAKYPDIIERSVKAVTILNALFEKEGTLTAERLKTLGKRDLRQYLRELPGMTPFIEAYILVHGFDAPAIPVDNDLLETLREEEAVAEDATTGDAQRLLENAIKAEEYVGFYLTTRKQVAEKKKRK